MIPTNESISSTEVMIEMTNHHDVLFADVPDLCPGFTLKQRNGGMNKTYLTSNREQVIGFNKVKVEI